MNFNKEDILGIKFNNKPAPGEYFVLDLRINGKVTYKSHLMPGKKIFFIDEDAAEKLIALFCDAFACETADTIRGKKTEEGYFFTADFFTYERKIYSTIGGLGQSDDRLAVFENLCRAVEDTITKDFS